MGWKEIKQKYERRTTEQGTEDLIARRIWHGLGLPGSAIKGINQVDKQLFGACDCNSPLCDRVLKLWLFALGTNDISRYVIKTKDINSQNDIIKDEEIVYTETIIITRKINSNDSYTFVIAYKEDFGRIFPPPYSVHKLNDTQWVLLAFDTETFVKNLGPYESLSTIKIWSDGSMYEDH